MTDPAAAAVDELGVRRVLGRAVLVADDGDLDDYATVYTDDAVWDLPGARCEGLPAIVDGARARRHEGRAGPGSGTRHHVTVLDVVLDGDAAHATSYWQFHRTVGPAPELLLVGRYDDVLRRTAGGWRISRRTITVG